MHPGGAGAPDAALAMHVNVIMHRQGGVGRRWVESEMTPDCVFRHDSEVRARAFVRAGAVLAVAAAA